MVSFPHAEQFVVVSTRSLDADMPPDAGRDARLALQLLHRLGSFLKFLSAKKSCSPAVQMNSAPQSTHASDLSWNSIGSTLSPTRARPAPTTLRLLSEVMGTARSCLDPHDPARAGRVDQSGQLVRLASLLLTRTLARQRLLGAATVAWLQVERMLLDILDDIFLLHLPLEATKRALDRLAFLNFHFSQY